MSKVNVLIVSSANLHKGFLEDIAAIDSSVQVRDGRKAFIAEIIKTDRKGEGESHFLKELDFSRDEPIPKLQEDLDTLLAQAEVIFGTTRLLPHNMLSRAPKVKWIHIANVGMDRLMSSDIFSGNTIVTNSRGAPAIAVAEHILAFIFMLAKNAPRLLGNKRDKRWERFVTMELRDRTVGIIGLGAIGGEVARLAKGIGMKVIATEQAAIKRGSGIWGVDELYPSQDLLEILSKSDFVVIAAPLTKETRGMIGERELRTMKPTAYLINAARGAIVDQYALTKALIEGWIAGAGLDAFETGPLPPDSKLWELPNVILSPHMAGSTDRRSQRLIELFCKNLRRYLAGEQLLNVVDSEKGF